MPMKETETRPSLRQTLRGLIGDLYEVGVKSLLGSIVLNQLEQANNSEPNRTVNIFSVMGIDFGILRQVKLSRKNGFNVIYPSFSYKPDVEGSILNSKWKFELFKSVMVGLNSELLPIIMRLPEEVRNPSLVGLLTINTIVIGTARQLSGQMDRNPNNTRVP